MWAALGSAGMFSSTLGLSSPDTSSTCPPRSGNTDVSRYCQMPPSVEPLPLSSCPSTRPAFQCRSRSPLQRALPASLPQSVCLWASANLVSPSFYLGRKCRAPTIYGGLGYVPKVKINFKNNELPCSHYEKSEPDWVHVLGTRLFKRKGGGKTNSSSEYSLFHLELI